MKAQCDKCKEIVALVFKTEPGGIRVTCPSCDAQYSVAAAETDADADADADTATDTATATATDTVTATAPDAACPKCGEPQKAAAACRRCGLAVAKWPTWNDPDAGDSSIVLGDVRAAAALFDLCLASWDDAARHDAFLAHCERASAW